MAEHRRLFLAASASIAAAAASIARAFTECAERIDDFLGSLAALAREHWPLFYVPSASESIALDRATAELAPTVTPWRAFKAFIARALKHDRWIGDGFGEIHASPA